jgi:hypothetical protein
VLGGTSQRTGGDPEPDPADRQAILNNVCALLPSLRKCVELLPQRQPNALCPAAAALLCLPSTMLNAGCRCCPENRETRVQELLFPLCMQRRDQGGVGGLPAGSPERAP